MRHLRELSPGSIKVEPEPAERMVRTTKDPNKSALYGLTDLAERLGFESAKISDLKAKISNHADVRSQSRPPIPTFGVDGPRECPEGRYTCPYDLAYKQSREFLFLLHIRSRPKQNFDLPCRLWSPFNYTERFAERKSWACWAYPTTVHRPSILFYFLKSVTNMCLV